MEIHTKNSEYTLRLLAFLQKLLADQEISELNPIVYGSLAYYFYTKDDTVQINDIDLLINKHAFDKLIAGLNRLGFEHEVTTYDSIKVFYDDLKISFDAKENYLSELSDQSQEITTVGSKIYVLNKESLISAYKRGADTIPGKKQVYEDKLKQFMQD